jgi:hypothetical protein
MIKNSLGRHTRLIELIEDGSIVQRQWWTGGSYATRTYLYTTPVKRAAGHIWQTRVIQNVVDLFADGPGLDWYSWSPVQYT